MSRLGDVQHAVLLAVRDFCEPAWTSDSRSRALLRTADSLLSRGLIRHRRGDRYWLMTAAGYGALASGHRAVGPRVLSYNDEYAARLRDALVDCGAEPVPDPLFGQHHELQTAIGPLKLHVFPNKVEPGAWVAGRFDDVEEAAALLGGDVNRFSGKWNHHYFGTPLADARRHLRAQLKRVLTENETCP